LTLAVPIICKHDGVLVVRDDLFTGSTKARFLELAFRDAFDALAIQLRDYKARKSANVKAPAPAPE
jgi:hypothetical protein